MIHPIDTNLTVVMRYRQCAIHGLYERGIINTSRHKGFRENRTNAGGRAIAVYAMFCDAKAVPRNCIIQRGLRFGTWQKCVGQPERRDHIATASNTLEPNGHHRQGAGLHINTAGTHERVHGCRNRTLSPLPSLAPILTGEACRKLRIR